MPRPPHSSSLALFRRPLGPDLLSTFWHQPSLAFGAFLPAALFGQTGLNVGPPFRHVWPNEGPSILQCLAERRAFRSKALLFSLALHLVLFGRKEALPFSLAYQAEQNSLCLVKQDRSELFCLAKREAGTGGGGVGPASGSGKKMGAKGGVERGPIPRSGGCDGEGGGDGGGVEEGGCWKRGRRHKGKGRRRGRRRKGRILRKREETEREGKETGAALEMGDARKGRGDGAVPKRRGTGEGGGDGAAEGEDGAKGMERKEEDSLKFKKKIREGY